jgi:mono/diheme cytochrome c family protein
MLAGRLAGTAPYGWEGDRETVAEYVGNTVLRLGGKGLASDQLYAISKFLLTVPPPPRADREDVAVQRGRVLFQDAGQRCASCHRGDDSTDADRHSVSAGSEALDTPSLRFVVGTGPYFHDGRYATLEDLLADPASLMGGSAILSVSDRSALAAYLRSL